MTPHEYLLALRSNPPGITLLWGSDGFIRKTCVSETITRLLPKELREVNLTRLTAPTPEEIITAAETLPLMSPRRLVIINDLPGLLPSKKEGTPKDASRDETLMEYLPDLPQTTCLLIECDGKPDGRGKLFKYLSQNGAVVNADPMNEGEASAFAKREADRLGMKLSQDCARYLVSYSGTDAGRLRNELEKLAAYLSPDAQATPEDIRTVCTPTVETGVFALMDAVSAGRVTMALDRLGKLLTAGENEFMILALMLRHFRILCHIRELSGADAAKLLGISPYFAGGYRKQAAAWPPEALQAAYRYLLENETALKQGRISQYNAAQRAVLAVGEILQGGSPYSAEQ